MNDTSEKLIMKYLLNQLPLPERKLFESKLANDPALARQTSILQAEIDAMELLVEQDLRARFGHQKTVETKEPVYLTFHRKLLVAASALLICAMTWIIGSHKTKVEEKKVVNAPQSQTPEVSKPTTIPTSQEKTSVQEAERLPEKIVTHTPKINSKKANKNTSDTSPHEVPVSNDNKHLANVTLENSEKIRALSAAPNIANIFRDQTRGEKSEVQNEKLIADIEAACKNKDYLGILRLSLSLPASLLPAKHWLQGQAHFQLRDYSAATQSFEALVALHHEDYIHRDEWMYLLALLAKNGKQDPIAESLIEKISKDRGHDYFGELQKLQEIF